MLLYTAKYLIWNKPLLFLMIYTFQERENNIIIGHVYDVFTAYNTASWEHKHTSS